MHASKIVLSSLATVALTFGGVAQAEAIRAGASLPVAKSAKLSRKAAKKGVELNQAEGAAAAAGGVGGGIGTAGIFVIGSLAAGAVVAATVAATNNPAVSP